MNKHFVTPAYAEDIRHALTLHSFLSLNTIALADVTSPMIIKGLRPIEGKGSLVTVKRLSRRINEFQSSGTFTNLEHRVGFFNFCLFGQPGQGYECGRRRGQVKTGFAPCRIKVFWSSCVCAARNRRFLIRRGSRGTWLNKRLPARHRRLTAVKPWGDPRKRLRPPGTCPDGLYRTMPARTLGASRCRFEDHSN